MTVDKSPPEGETPIVDGTTYQLVRPLDDKSLLLQAFGGGRMVAIKKFKASKKSLFDQKKALLQKATELGSKWIAPFVGAEDFGSELWLVTECGGPTLSEIIAEYDMKGLAGYPQMPFPILKCYWLQMLQAVKQLHDLHGAHGSLAPCHFVSFGGSRLRLVSFGMGKRNIDQTITFETSYEANDAHWAYQSPDGSLNEKSDVWSLGAILFRMVYGFDLISNYGGKCRNAQNAAKRNITLKPLVYSNIFQILEACLRKNGFDRLGVHQLLELTFDAHCIIFGEELTSTVVGTSAAGTAVN